MHGKNTVTHATGRQRGAVLIVSLIMLAVMSLFVISMLRTSILELKIGGSSHVAAMNFANAEYAINKWINDNTGRMAPNFLSLTALSAGCNVSTSGTGPCTDPPTVNGGSVALLITQMRCGIWRQFGTDQNTSLNAVEFDIRATAVGTLGGSTVVHQGVQALAASGACP